MQKDRLFAVAKRVIFALSLAVLTIPEVVAQKDLVISGGNSVSSYVCANRRAYVWGNNQSGTNYGLLGTGDMASSFIDTPTLVNLPGGIDVQQINSGSGSHFVVLDCNTSVWSWGNNSFGQTGTGAASGCNGVPVTTPTQVLAGVMAGTAWDDGTGHLTGVDVVYAGNNNSFAILNDGRLVSWGGNSNGCAPPYDNANGQLGDGSGTYSDQYSPVLVVDGSGTPLTGVIQVFAGDNVAYALVDTDGDGIGTVYSWGNGLNGTLGRNAAGTGNPNNGTAIVDDRARPVYYGDQTIMDNITAISSGDVFGMALDVDGYVWTWGNGGWNSATGHNDQMSDSEPGRVIAGSTVGASNDGTYLLASAIGGGQGYGMAVTIDGKPVSWGGNSCADGGLRGDGTTGPPAFGAGPSYITYGGGLVHDNVTLINRGDHWGFYGTADNDFYAWGCNQFGQLGIGGTTDQLEATQISPPTGCTFRDPAPFVNLTPGNTSVCSNTWAGTMLDAGFTAPAGLESVYEIRWYEDGVLQTTTDASTTTFLATNVATYTVEIEYIGTNAGCQTYDIETESMTFIEPAAPFSDPGTNEYCGTTVTTANVTGTGTFEWYAASTGGSLLATSTNGGNIDTPIPLASLNQLSPTQYEVWVEDVSSFTTSVGPTTTQSGWGRDGANAVSQNSWIEFTTTQAMTIDFVDVYAYNAWNGSFTIDVELQDNTGAFIDGVTTAPLTGTTNTTQHTVALGLSVPGAGTYRLAYVGGAGQLHYDGNSHNTGNWPYADPFGVINLTNNYDGGSIKNDNYSYFYNWQVTTGTVYPCGRLQVLLNENCPPCAPPTALSVDQADPTELCDGDNQTLSGTYTLATPTDQYYYTWLQDGAVVSGPSTTYSDYTITGAGAADAGTYTLRIEDGNNSNAACYLEDAIDVDVFDYPDVSVTDPADECTPNTVSITGSWTDANATGGTVSYHTGLPLDGTTQVPTPGAITTSGPYYVLIDNNNCRDSAVVNVTINTTPDLNVTDPADECEPNTVDITGTWTDNNGTTPTVTYHSATPPTVANEVPDETAINMSGTYYLLADNAGCTDEASITVTIDPATSITTNPSSQTVCDGDNVTFTVAATGSGTLTYQWYKDAALLTGETASTLSLTAVTSTDAGNYSVEVTGACGTVTSSTATLTVNDPTVITTQPTDFSTCAGSNASFSVVATGTGTLTYQWYKDGVIMGGETGSTLSLTAVSAADEADYSVEVTGTCGTVTSVDAALTITANESPTVSLTTGDPTTLCEGGTVSFTANPSGGTPDMYTFYDASGPTVLQGPSATATYTTAALTADMDVYVEMTWTSLCPAAGAPNPAVSNTISLTVDPLPDAANIVETDFNTCTNAASLTNDPVTTGNINWSAPSGSVAPTSATTADVTGLPVGATTITLTVSSPLGLCPDNTDDVTITVLGTLTAPDAGENDTICETDADPLLVGNAPGGGETGTWGAIAPASITPAGQTSNLQLGENIFYYTMDNGSCDASDTVRVIVDETPGNIGFTADPITTCDVNVQLTAQVPSPGTGTWSNISGPGSPTISAADLNNPTGVISNLDDGITTVDWTVTNGQCAAAPITLTIDKQGSTTSATITLDGGAFTNQDVTFTSQDLCISDAYTVTGSSPNAGAGETASWTIVSGTSVSINQNSTETQTLTLNSSGATVLQWSINSTVPGCSANTGTVTLDVDDAPSAITPALTDFTVCGSSGTMVPSGATTPATGTGTWTIGSGTISGFPSTNASQSFTGLTGSATMVWTVSTGGVCPDVSDDVIVTATTPEDPAVTLTASDDPACFGQTNVTFSAAATDVTSPTFDFYVGGVLQQSSTLSTYSSSTILDGQTVEVIVTTNSTCYNTQTASDQTSITVEFEPSPVIGDPDFSICEGTATSLTVFTSGGNVQWYQYTPGSGTIPTVNSTTYPILGLSQTTTFFAIEDNGVCPAVTSDSVTINVDEMPVVTIGGPYTLFEDETVILDGFVSVGSATWTGTTNLDDPTSTDPLYSPVEAEAGLNTFTLTAVNGNCTNSADVDVLVLLPITIPNVFTPNGDGDHDDFYIKGLESYAGATIEIFNRWGTPVYKDTGDIIPWDGMRNGEAMPVATYYYILDLGIANDESDRYTGSVTIVR